VSVAERRRLPALEGHGERSTAVLVVAGSELIGARIEAMLRARADFSVALSNPAQLSRRLDELSPAVVVLALGTEAAARALETLRALPSVPAVVLLSADPVAAWKAHARRSGVRAVLREDVTAEELAAAVAAAKAGLVALHPDALESSVAARAAERGDRAPSLTPRELEVLEMLAEGLSNRVIAARLRISSQTVKFHVASILAKLDAGSRTEAVTFGVRQGLIAL
jgi:DNA-binding NarL/FixJ family response regulator